ncbi:MAG: hypothetical protein ACTSU5_03600 [Promethearchaeota archaeon]
MFQYIDVVSIAYNNYVEVSTHDAAKFVELAEQKGERYILRDRAETGVVYFCFSENGLVFRIKAHTLETLEELVTALDLKVLKRVNERYEFVNQTLHYPGVTVEFMEDPEDPESQVLTRVVKPKKYLSNPKKIVKAVLDSKFLDFGDFVEAFELGFTTKADYEKATNAGFKDAKDFFESKEQGFTSAAEYYEARERGFKSKVLFDAAVEKGFKSFGDFRVAEKGGFRDAEEFHEASSKGIFKKGESPSGRN